MRNLDVFASSHEYDECPMPALNAPSLFGYDLESKIDGNPTPLELCLSKFLTVASQREAIDGMYMYELHQNAILLLEAGAIITPTAAKYLHELQYVSDQYSYEGRSWGAEKEVGAVLACAKKVAAVSAAAAAAAARRTSMLVQVPTDARVGQQMYVTSPGGKQHVVNVPPGMGLPAGSHVQMSVPCDDDDDVVRTAPTLPRANAADTLVKDLLSLAEPPSPPCSGPLNFRDTALPPEWVHPMALAYAREAAAAAAALAARLLTPLLVTVPPGVCVGQSMVVTAPDGQQYLVVVPEGAGPGCPFQIHVPCEDGQGAAAAAAAARELVRAPVHARTH